MTHQELIKWAELGELDAKIDVMDSVLEATAADIDVPNWEWLDLLAERNHVNQRAQRIRDEIGVAR